LGIKDINETFDKLASQLEALSEKKGKTQVGQPANQEVIASGDGLERDIWMGWLDLH
jgi:hypothetical protein